MNKNLHLLPTNKPSKLLKSEKGLFLQKYIYENKVSVSFGLKNQNIYITNDEEIKERDWYFNFDYNYVKQCVHTNNKVIKNIIYFDENSTLFDYRKDCKKIILTTDQDLIKDGVQAINDEFLEWFVNNPSCEQISEEEVYFHGSGYYKASELSEQEKEKYSFMKEYKIIIPKEESKQEICEYLKEVGCIKDICSCNTRPKQETLEEAAEHDWIYNEYGFEPGYNPKRCIDGAIQKPKFINGFVKGANWQQEKILKFILDEDNHTESELVNPSIDVQKLVLFIEQFKTKNSK